MRKTGWAPDAKEGRGDARQIYAEEIQWLKERLSKVVPKPTALHQSAHALATEIAEKVGRIRYEAKSHGWSLPEQTLARNVGDCQDKSLLLAELLIEAGFGEVAICRGVEENYKPGEAGHAWVLTMLGTELWKIESTNGTMFRANSGSHLDRYEAVATVWRLPTNGDRR